MPDNTTGLIPESHRDILEGKAFAHIATIGPKGEPYVSPVWFDWDGTHLRFSQVETRQKFRNLKRDPRIAVSVSDPNDPYRNLALRGEVVRIDPDTDRSFVDKLAQKYMGQQTYPWDPPGTDRFVVVVEPRRAVPYP